MTKKEKLLEKIDSIFKHTQIIIDGIVHGNRMSLKDMTNIVSIALSLDTKDIFHYVSDFAHHSDDGFVSRGKNGGFIKGSKVLKEPKTAMTTMSSSPILDSSDEDTSLINF